MSLPDLDMNSLSDPETEPDFVLTDFDPVPGLAEAIRAGDTTVVDWRDDEEQDRANEWAREQRRRNRAGKIQKCSSRDKT